MAFGSKLFVILKILQAIFSLVALISGVYTALKFLSLASDIDTVVTDAETIVNGTLSAKDAKIVAEFGSAIENFFSGPPVRAYFLASVGLWSLCAVLYLVIAQRATKHSRLNKRSIIISLETFTIIAWIAALVAAVLLDVEYSLICVPFDYISKARIFDKAFEKYPVLHDTLPTCTSDLVATVAAALCLMLWCITCLVSCCTGCCGGKRKKGNNISRPGIIVSEQAVDTSQKSGFMVAQSPATPAPRCYSPASQTYAPVPEYSSPQSHFSVSPTGRWGK